MKRILFFVSSMQGGGAERVAALLCNYWAERGHQLTLVPTFSGRGECWYPLDKRVELEFLADRVGSARKTPWTTWRRFLAMRRLMREWGPDVVVSFLPNVNVAALLVSRGLGIPVVVSERIYPPIMPIGPVWPRLRRLAYPWASIVVMQTQRGAEWLAREIPSACAMVIPNPCVYPLPAAEPHINPSSWIEPDRRLLLAVGRLDKQKGFDILIQAFAELADRFSGWDLVILGEGHEREAWEGRVDALGLRERTYLPGRVGNLVAWYERADLYVMSSRFEGFPNTLLEAMAHSLPAVSFDCDTGPADIIRDGVDGMLVQPTAGTAGLREALAGLMADKLQRQRMAAEAFSVRERFSMERVAMLWDKALGFERVSAS